VESEGLPESVALIGKLNLLLVSDSKSNTLL
jgi:hypothetical protein